MSLIGRKIPQLQAVLGLVVPTHVFAGVADFIIVLLFVRTIHKFTFWFKYLYTETFHMNQFSLDASDVGYIKEEKLKTLLRTLFPGQPITTLVRALSSPYFLQTLRLKECFTAHTR
jgi:hypothetical protein